MTNYPEVDREEVLQSADLHAAAAGESEREQGAASQEVSDDEIFDQLDSEALASWNLRRIRTALGLSQQQIAERLRRSGWNVRLAQTQIAKIERRERPWRVNEMFAIAEVLGIEWRELFRGGGLKDDPHMVLLASRLKYQEAERAAEVARDSWRDAARRAHDAGQGMCETAARLGIKDADVMHFLEMRYHYLEWLERENDLRVDVDSLSEREEAAKRWAEDAWSKFVDDWKVMQSEAESEDGGEDVKNGRG